jgi:hypothetical protein
MRLATSRRHASLQAERLVFRGIHRPHAGHVVQFAADRFMSVLYSPS